MPAKAVVVMMSATAIALTFFVILCNPPISASPLRSVGFPARRQEAADESGRRLHIFSVEFRRLPLERVLHGAGRHRWGCARSERCRIPILVRERAAAAVFGVRSRLARPAIGTPRWFAGQRRRVCRHATAAKTTASAIRGRPSPLAGLAATTG